MKGLVSHFMDAFTGVKIAGQVTVQMLENSGAPSDPSVNAGLVQQYTAWLQSNEHGQGESTSQLSIVSPAGEVQAGNQGAVLIGPIMAGMLVFFVFFMGANGAESIIREQDQGTLARLFTTPARLSAILAGSSWVSSFHCASSSPCFCWPRLSCSGSNGDVGPLSCLSLLA